jgi:K+-transporting ATPase ATPase C chain
MRYLVASLRVAVATIAVCVVGYGAAILGVAQLLIPATASGSLITLPDGRVVGSRLIAQRSTEPRYFGPRPSAVDYNGAGAGASNKSPTSTDLTARAEEISARYGATAEVPLPPELAAASGSGLDPHISEHAARYQAGRVAAARGLAQAAVEALVGDLAFSPGGPFTQDRVVNVLELNLALDAISASR